MNCLVCGNATVKKPGKGRKPRYCSPTCKAVANKRSSRVVGQRECALPECRREIPADRPGAETCSPRCQGFLRWKRQGVKTSRCLNCHMIYRPKNHDRVTFCGRDCFYAFRARRAEAREVPDLIARVRRVGLACRVCGGVKPGDWSMRLHCSAECMRRENADKAKLHYEPAPPRTKKCGMCGCAYEFQGHGASSVKYCGLCRPIAEEAAREVQRRKRRLRMEGQEQVPYRRKDIFDRDGWTCWICNKPIDPKLKSPDPQSPTIDHVVAVSKGGGDTPDNVRAAHMICNSLRGAEDAQPAPTPSMPPLRATA